MTRTRKQTQGFTLIELLTVIAIIGILAAIIIPTVGAVREQAARNASLTDARSIAQAYATYANSGGRVRTIPDDVNIYEFAGTLADEGGLRTAEVWYIDNDPEVAALEDIPVLVLESESTGDTDFVLNGDFDGSPVSYAAAAGLSPNADAPTTPVIWTRGLETNGSWGDDSPWEGKGGHVAYLDGHVKWFESVAGQLVTQDNQETDSIDEAIGDAVIVEYSGG